MRKFVAVAVVGVAAWLAVAAVFAGTAQALDKNKVHRLIVQLSDNDPKMFTQTLNNISNLTQEIGIDNIQIELVAFGFGLDIFLKNSPLAARLQSLHANGNLKYSICQNTMKGRKLTPADLLPADYIKDSFVPAGIVRVIELQESGWSYIRS
jgi:hypothetical protein